MQIVRDLGSGATSRFVASGVATAGGQGDNQAVTGATIDRIPQGEQNYLGGALLIPFTATLAAAATLTVTVTEQQSSDGANWDAATPVYQGVVATGGQGGTTETGCLQFPINLAPKKRFIRHVITPDLSAAGVDTCRWAACIVLGGAVVEPVA
jgi:hypothetical protein